jgi:ribosome-binding protein aMBF1 (putative translation factor)
VFPTIIQTLGDHIQVKRVEKGFDINELAEKIGISKYVVVLWETDGAIPNERQWQLLESILCLDLHLKSMKSNT